MIRYSLAFTFFINVCSVSGIPKNYESATSSAFPFISRKEWGAKASTDNRPFRAPVEYVVIHHTYIPPACTTTQQCSQAMRSMQNYHNSMGWGDIGYNFCVGNEGGVYEGRGWNNIGIHAGRANSISVGICLIGDWRVDTPPAAMLASTKALIAQGVKLGAISPTYRVLGHKQIMDTECPGTALFNIISGWDRFTREVSF